MRTKVTLALIFLNVALFFFIFQFERLRFALLIGLPGAIFLVGAVVYWTRRT